MVRGRRNMSVWESGNDVKMLRKKYYENHTQGKSGCDRWIRGRMEWTMSLKESIGGPLGPLLRSDPSDSLSQLKEGRYTNSTPAPFFPHADCSD